MPTKLKIFAMVGALAAGTSSAVMAQYACPPGYALYGGICRPVAAPVYPSNPVSGAASGEAAGAATGAVAAGPVGADRWRGNWHRYRRRCRHRQCALGRPGNLGLRPWL